MNRTRKFVYNTVSAAAAQLVTLVVGLITPRIMLVYYGSEINGLVTSIAQFISYFNLVEVGLSGATVYALYKPLADNDANAISGVVSAARKFYNKAGLIFTALTIAFAVAYPIYITGGSLTYYEKVALVLILGINGALEFFTLGKYRALLTADQKMYVISIATIAHMVLNTVIIFVFARSGMGIVFLRLIATASIFLRTAILAVYCKKKYPNVNSKYQPPNTKALNKRWDAFFLQILGIIHSGAPVIILTIMLKNLKLISVYSIYNMVLAGIGGVVGVFSSGLSASFGDIIVRGELKTLQKSYREFEFAYYSIITVMYAVTAVTILQFVAIYTKDITDVNYCLPSTGLLFSINGLLYNMKTPQGMLVIAAGMYKETKWQTAIQASIIVIGGIVLVPLMGINGMLIASIMSNIYRTIDLAFFIPKNLTNLPPIGTLLRLVIILINSVVIIVPFNFISIETKTYLQWIVFACIATVYSIGIVFISGLIFERSEMRNLLKRLKYLLVRG